MPFEVGVIVAAAVLLGVTVIAIYTLSTLKEWVRNKIGEFRNRQIVTGALRSRLESGNIRVIPFVFDEIEDTVLDTDHIEAKSLDAEIQTAFAGADELILESTS